MNKLVSKVDNAMVALKCKAYCAAKSFNEDERGVSPIIATVLTILIAVLLAGIFWNSIQGWITGVWDDIVKGTDAIAASSK